MRGVPALVANEVHAHTKKRRGRPVGAAPAVEADERAVADGQIRGRKRGPVTTLEPDTAIASIADAAIA